MNDFKSYPEGEGKKNEADRGKAEQTANLAAMLAKAFSGKSQSQIFQTILAQAEQGKRDGTLTNADLDNFYNSVAPMIDGFKRKKLQQVIVKLKAL